MSLFGLFESEQRSSLEDPTYPLTSTTLIDWLSGARTDSGVRVTETGSLTMAAVYRATSLISSVGAALPLIIYNKGTKDVAMSSLLDDVHPEMTNYEMWKLSYVHRCLWGNFYAQRKLDRMGRTKWLYPISPDRVRVGKVTPTTLNPSGKMFEVTDEDGHRDAFTSDDIFHIPGLGYDGITGVSPVRMAAQGIGVGLAAERYAAKLFGSGNLMSGLLQTEQRLDETDAQRLQARWRAKMSGVDRAHEVAVLDAGAKFQSLTIPSSDAQMLESRKFEVMEIARYFGVPPFMLMDVERSTSWGTGLEQQAIGFVQFDMHPAWLAPTEQRITKALLPSDRYAKYKVEGLLRGDAASRASFYQVMRMVGAFSANDIRELEDRPPIKNGDTYLEPLAMGPLGGGGLDKPPHSPKGQNDPSGEGDWYGTDVGAK
jgi:HK97 family phage portal protein